MTVSIHEHEFVVAERDALRRELASARAEICRRVTLNEMTQQLEETEKSLAKYYETQLAASQAREQQFRDLLLNCVVPFTNSTMVTIAKWRVEEAFSTPNDTTTLSAVVAKAGEVMRERVFKEVRTHYLWTSVAKAHETIRAIPAITIEDLKGGA